MSFNVSMCECMYEAFCSTSNNRHIHNHFRTLFNLGSTLDLEEIVVNVVLTTVYQL